MDARTADAPPQVAAIQSDGDAILDGETAFARDIMSASLAAHSYSPTILGVPPVSDPVQVAVAIRKSSPTRNDPGPKNSQNPGDDGGLTTSVPGPGSGGGGISLSLFGMLVALVALAASPYVKLLLSAPVHSRPVPFVSLLERPG
jgi:hypothetical protein